MPYMVLNNILLNYIRHNEIQALIGEPLKITSIEKGITLNLIFSYMPYMVLNFYSLNHIRHIREYKY
ncbi:hypothetical protein D3C72_616910 [compost metagenome]